MRTLSAVPKDQSPAMQELRQRIALSNRSRLKIGRDRLDGIASALAASRSDRAQFIADPTSYLRGQALPVASCQFTKPAVAKPQQTAEVISSFIYVTVENYACMIFSVGPDCMTRVVTVLIGAEVSEKSFGPAGFDWSEGSEVV